MNPPEEEPVFAEPWQAQAFALAVHLRDRGQIVWSDFSAALAEEIAAFGCGYKTERYYDCWLAALERLLIAKGQAEPRALADLKDAWAEAYRRTPHGQPVQLQGRGPA